MKCVQAPQGAGERQEAARSARSWSTSTTPNDGHSCVNRLTTDSPATRPTARAVSTKPTRHMNHPLAACIADRTASLPGSATYRFTSALASR